MRTILGQKLDEFTFSGVAAASATSGSTGTKIDLQPSLVDVHHDTKVFSLDFHVAAVDPSTHSRLMTITLIVLPIGHGVPSTVEDWLASSYPKGTVDVSGVSTLATTSSTATTTTPATSVVAASPSTQVDPTAATAATPASPTGATAVAATPTLSTAASVPAAATTPATVAATATPVPAGSTLVNLPIADLPNNKYHGQILLTYES